MEEWDYISGLNLEFLFNNTKDVIWSIDLDMKLVCGNKPFKDFYKRVIGTIPEKGDTLLVPEFGQESLDYWRSLYQRVLSGEHVVEEFSNGLSLHQYNEITLNPIYDNQNVVIGAGCFFRDITAYKQKEIELTKAHKQLVLSEERYKAVFEHSHDLIVLIDGNGLQTEVSPSIKNMLGYNPEEMLQKPIWDFVHPDDLKPTTDKFYNLAINPGAHEQLRVRYQHKNGKYKHLEVSATNQLHNPAVKAIITNTRDITQQVEAEEKLRGSELRYRSIAENFPNGNIGIIGLDFRFRYVAGADLKLYGIKPLDMLGSYYPGNFSPEHTTYIEERMRQVAKGKQITFQVPFAGFIYIVSAVPLYDDAQQVCEILLVAQNITQIKRVEDALKESEEKFRMLSEHSPVGIFQVAPNGYCTWMNERMCEICGFYLKDGLGFGFTKYIYPDDRERISSTFLRSAANNEATPLMTYRILTHDRQAKWVYTQAAPLRNNLGEVISYVGTIEDISELKHYQDELLESRNQLEKVLNNIPEGVIFIDNDNSISYANDKASAIIKVAKKDLLGQDLWERFPIADNPAFAEQFTKSKQLGQPFQVTSYYNLLEVWIHIDGIPNNEGFLLFFQDISDKKDLENHIERIYEMSPAMLGIVDRTFHFTNFNPAMANILGFTDDELRSKPFYDFVHPDDKPSAIKAARKIMSTQGFTRTYENRYLTQSGEYKWISWSVYGQPSRKLAYFVAQDITARKQEEEYLRMLESVVINTKDSVVITEAEPLDAPGPKIVYVNPSFTQNTGYTFDDVKGQSPRILQGPDTNIDELQKLKTSLENWQTYQGEFKNYKKDGTPFWTNLTITPVANNNGRFTHWVSVQRDVTQIKQAELKLREFAKQQESLAMLGFTVVSIDDLETIYRTCAATLQQTLGMEAVKIITLDKKNQSLTSAYALGIENTKDNLVVDANSHAAYCLKLGKEVIVTDYSQNLNFQPSEALIKIGVKSGVAVTLHGNDGAQGILGIYTKKTRQYTNDEVNYIKAVANILSSAIKRIETTEQLNLSEKKYRLLFKENPLPIWIYDPQTLEFVDVNEAVLQQYGYERSEFLSMKLTDLLVTEDTKRFTSTIKKYKTERYIGNDWRHKRKNGDIIQVEIASNPISLNGKMYRLTLANDVTRKKELEAEREKYQEELEHTVTKRTSQLLESNHELEAFNYTVSHDLRTPIRAIQMFVALLERECATSDACKEFTSSIRMCTEEMTNLINDLLEFSRIRRQDLDVALVDMDNLAHEITDSLLSIEERKDIKVSIKPLTAVPGDKVLLKSVWQNLISNAIKYSKNNSPVKIAISSKQRNGCIEFCVADNGIGFDMQYVHKLFKPFSRLHSSSEYKGTGAGLAIVNRIINRHKGSVSAKSAPNKGSKFYFTIPTKSSTILLWIHP